MPTSEFGMVKLVMLVAAVVDRKVCECARNFGEEDWLINWRRDDCN
jgi:hypothetical protein